MAYFGKEYVFEKEDNFEDFSKGVGASEDDAKHMLSLMKCSLVLEKNSDGYKLTVKTPNGNKEVVFKAGVPFTNQVRDGVESKSTITVDGDTFTQVQDFEGRGILVSKKEFSPTQLKITVTTDKWDRAAYVYYKAK